MEARHNSANSYFRNPLGALKCGESVTLRLEFDDIHDNMQCYIVLDLDGEVERTPMDRTENGFVGTITAPDISKLYYYFFEVSDGDNNYFVGCKSDNGTGEAQISNQVPMGFQLTVYEKTFKTPDWSKEAIMYQIFPDRFAQGDEHNLIRGMEYHKYMGRRVFKHSLWNERPLSRAIEGYESYDPIDYFGGDIRGIINKLDDLKEMGISVIYLNPIVEAASNHRYNTANYKQMDPILGPMEDFVELCEKAKARNIKIILDGVYSHTGSDSVYFNKNGNYPERGAYQGEDSKYYSWYNFKGSRDDYDCWWGFPTLPEVNELDPNWQEEIITGPDSVFKFWLKKGASGFRLDVADELPDEAIFLMRDSLKEEGEDKLLLGEVWEDATTKVSYGSKREYCMGKGLDCVMNYPLRKAIIAFLLQYTSAKGFERFLLSQQNNYPKEMYYSQMNLLSSHDVARIRTALGAANEGDGLTREEQGRYVMSKFEEARGEELTKLAYAIIFALPGMPCIYYGDEQGMEGFKDPFNREPYIEKSPSMKKFMNGLCQIRNTNQVLKTGAAGFTTKEENAIILLRFILDGNDAFGREYTGGVILSAFNPTTESKDFQMNIHEITNGLSQSEISALSRFNPIFANTVSGQGTIEVLSDGKLSIHLPPRSYGYFSVGM